MRVWYLKLIHLGGSGSKSYFWASDKLRVFWQFLASPWITDHSCFESFPGKNNLAILCDMKLWEFKSTFVQVMKQVQSYFLKKGLELSVFIHGRSANLIFFVPFIPIKTSVFKWAFCPPAERFYLSAWLVDKYSQWLSSGQRVIIGSIVCNF